MVAISCPTCGKTNRINQLTEQTGRPCVYCATWLKSPPLTTGEHAQLLQHENQRNKWFLIVIGLIVCIFLIVWANSF